MTSLLALLLWASLAQATVFDAGSQPSGVLASAQTATGASANSIKIGAARNRALILTMRNTAGTATGDVQINCTGNVLDWANVVGGSANLVASAAAVSILYPGCEYRVNVSACSTCSVTVNYTLLPDMQ